MAPTNTISPPDSLIDPGLVERSSQVIVRNSARLNSDGLLLVNPPSDELCRHLQSDGHTLHVSTQDFGCYRWQSGNGMMARFEVVPGPSQECGTVILNLPREKDRLSMMLHALSCWMPDGTRLWVVGEIQAGIKSAGKYLANYFHTVTRLDSARHCGLYEATGPVHDSAFNLAGYEKSWALEFGGKTIEVVSLPGVFAHGRLDKGTELLLKSLENLQPGGAILDFACGSGVIASALMAAGCRGDLTLLDVSALAIDSSRRTLQSNGLQANLLPSDGLAELSGRFDWIISNPPFHSGVRNNLEIVDQFFSNAGTFLTESGRIVIVCNRHLPYATWLRNHFKQIDRLDGNAEFVVLQAQQPQR